MTTLLIVLAAVALAAIVRTLLLANELFVIKIRSGRARVVRGRVPQQLLVDLTDVARAAAVDHGELRAVSESKRPRIIARGAFSGDDHQRLRNVIGLWTVSQIRTARRR